MHSPNRPRSSPAFIAPGSLCVAAQRLSPVSRLRIRGDQMGWCLCQNGLKFITAIYSQIAARSHDHILHLIEQSEQLENLQWMFRWWIIPPNCWWLQPPSIAPSTELFKNNENWEYHIFPESIHQWIPIGKIENHQQIQATYHSYGPSYTSFLSTNKTPFIECIIP